MRLTLVAIAIVSLLSFGTAALAGPNATTTMPLHALDTGFGLCPIPPPTGPDPCAQGMLDTEVSLGVTFAGYLLVRNYDNVAGVQTAFDWPVGWVFMFGLWDCQSGQVNGVVPTAPGATTGTIATAFDLITGGVTSPIGRMHMIATGPGCLTQLTSSFPFGTHVVSGTGDTDPVVPENRGSICDATSGAGVNACEPVIPVEPTTWGAIKSQYQ